MNRRNVLKAALLVPLAKPTSRPRVVRDTWGDATGSPPADAPPVPRRTRASRRIEHQLLLAGA